MRTKEPFRGQAEIRFEMPEDALPEDHVARLLWRIVLTLDLSAFTARAKACVVLLVALASNLLAHATTLLG